MTCPIFNSTPFHASSFTWLDDDGSRQRVLVIKGTWLISLARVAPAERQLPLHRYEVTERLGSLPLEPAQLQTLAGREEDLWIRHESDLTGRKPSFDLLINAWALAPDGRPADRIHAEVEAFGRRTRLIAHAPRRWQPAGFGSLAPALVAPVRRVPLLYPFAYGGGTADASGRRQSSRDNRSGMGYYLDAGTAKGAPLPWVEDPSEPIRHWDDRPAPLALGVRDPGDAARKQLMGSFDARWRSTRAPAPPDDFDPRHRNAAALQFPQTPKAGQQVRLHNLSPRPLMTITLPAVRVHAGAETAAGARLPARKALWDTLVVEPDEDRFALVWRVSFPDPDPLHGPISRLTVSASPGEATHG